MDNDTQRAINDVVNNFQAQFDEFLGKYRQATEGIVEVLQKILETQKQVQEEVERQGAAINFMDEAFANVATRLDQLEGVLRVEDPTEVDDGWQG